MPSSCDNIDPDRGFNFVSVDPSAAGEKADSRSLIRANAGRYIWQQRRQAASDGASSRSRSRKDNRGRLSKPHGTSSRRLPNRSRESAVSRSIGNGQTVLTPPSDEDDFVPVDKTKDEPSLVLLKEEPDEEEKLETSDIPIDDSRRDSLVFPLEVGVSSLFASYPSDLDEKAARRFIHYAAQDLLPNLIPALPVGGRERRSEFWLPLSVNHPALFSAIMYGTATHEQGRKRLERPDALALTKKERLQIMIVEDEAIRRLNTIISDSSQALTDEVVLAIMTIAFSRYENTTIPTNWQPHPSPLRRLQWLDVYCSLDLDRVHVLGLLQVISLKGGLHKIKIEGLAETLSFAGIMLATRGLSKPLLPYVPLVKTSKGPSEQPEWPPNVLAQISDYSPERDYHQYVRAGLTEEFGGIIRDLHTYSIVLDLYMKGILHNPGNPIMVDRRNYIQHRLMSLPSITEYADDPVFVETHRIYEPCRLATMIYTLLTVFPVPPSNAPLTQLALMVRLALTQSDPRQSWRSAPDLLLWAFVLGAIASGMGGIDAADCEVRSWYVGYLYRLNMIARIRSWDDLKRIMKKYLWLDSLCDPHGEKLWAEITEFGLNRTA